MGYNALPQLMTGGPDTSGFIQNALAVKGYQDNKAHQQNVLTQNKEAQTRAAYASAFTNALRATDQEQAKSIWAGTLQSHGLPVNPEEMPEFAITPQGSTITFKDGTVIKGRGDAVAALAQAWGQDPTILQNPAVMGRFAELGGSITLPQNPKPVTPGAYKTWVTPDNKIVNIPNNQEPPPGAVPYSAGEDLQVFGPDGQPLMRHRRGGRISGDDQKQIGTIPPGFKAIYDDNGNVTGMEAIPGGPAERELTEKATKARNSMALLEIQWDTVEKTIKEAIDSIGPFTTGVGSLLSVLPETAARDMREKLATIRANIGFDKLQDMRANSPTGGALGQVSDLENKLLQAVQGSLDPQQSAQQLSDNLATILENLRKLRDYKKWAYEYDYRDHIKKWSAEQSKVRQMSDDEIKQLVPDLFKK